MLNGMETLVFGAIGLVLLVGIPYGVGRFALGPLDRTVRAIKAQTRFQLTDLISLMLLMQILLAALSQFVDFNTDYLRRGMIWFVVIFPSLLVLAMWGGGVSYISQAGVNSPLRRTVFVVLVLPLTVGLMIGATGLAECAVFGGIGLVMKELGWRRMWNEDAVLPVAAGIGAGLAAVPALAYALRLIVDWVVKGAPGTEKMPPYHSV